MALTKTRWWLPLFSLSLGVLCLAAFWIGDDPRSGLYALALMAAVGMLFLAGGRFDLVRGLRETAETSTGSGSTCTRATSQDSSRSGSSSACACGNGRTPEAECRTCSSAPSAVSRTSSRWAFSGGVHEGRGHRARAARGRRDAHGVGQHGRTSGVRVRARDSRTGWAGGRKARPRRRRGCALRALLPRPRTRGAKDNGRPGAPRHLGTAPIGARTGESALLASPAQRMYFSDHVWGTRASPSGSCSTRRAQSSVSTCAQAGLFPEIPSRRSAEDTTLASVSRRVVGVLGRSDGAAELPRDRARPTARLRLPRLAVRRHPPRLGRSERGLLGLGSPRRRPRRWSGRRRPRRSARQPPADGTREPAQPGREPCRPRPRERRVCAARAPATRKPARANGTARSSR